MSDLPTPATPSDGEPRTMRTRDERRRRRLRFLIVVVFAIAIGVVLWIWVFPYIDRTFVNRPEIGALRTALTR